MLSIPDVNKKMKLFRGLASWVEKTSLNHYKAGIIQEQVPKTGCALSICDIRVKQNISLSMR
jgi:hypothetical protein